MRLLSNVFDKRHGFIVLHYLAYSITGRQTFYRMADLSFICLKLHIIAIDIRMISRSVKYLRKNLSIHQCINKSQLSFLTEEESL